MLTNTEFPTDSLTFTKETLMENFIFWVVFKADKK